MALSNRERIGRALELLSEGLRDVVDEHMSREWGPKWNEVMAAKDAEKNGPPERTLAKDDVYTQLRAITEQGYYFKSELSRAQQSYAEEIRDVRNDWAHQNSISNDDTYRALDSMERLLRAVGSIDSADDVMKLRLDQDKVIAYERQRNATRRATTRLQTQGSLKPWREVIQPHDDVAQGEFSASEFAADLHLVHTGDVRTPEYAHPREFFARTYITEGLHDLLDKAVRRLSGDASASPIVNLQTNFGGGKTHSMLALYHIFSGAPKSEFTPEVARIVQDAGDPKLEDLGVRRVVLVGTYLQAGAPIRTEGDTKVHTLWGELAWQLGGRKAYEQVAEADQNGTNPGDALKRVIQEHSPCLILIDEWVAYARQLDSARTLPAGTFDTQFTFAQALTEIVSAIPGAMLVVSVPASDSGEASDLEIGGERGRDALKRLQNVLGRSANPWRPSNKQESFEIVRRRLFKDADFDASNTIASTAKKFVELYRDQAQEFPSFASEISAEYEARIRASYPLHPELLDRLYDDWSTLERFQRTRGVLKLVATIVHELWQSGDESPMILPGTVPLGATSVNTELSQYLQDSWKPIIDSDIDGEGSVAAQIDSERSALTSRMVTQRVARTIFMGAAPRQGTAHKGIDKQYVWLGTAMPGDVVGNFGTALELLGQRSTYFYEEQGSYWFDTSASINKTAQDLAEQYREDNPLVWNEIIERLRKATRNRGIFARVHVAPTGPVDVQDDEGLKLVIVHPRYTFKTGTGAATELFEWVENVVDNAGNGQRMKRNRVVFLASEREGTDRLMTATRLYLAWQKVASDSQTLNLTPQQANQAKTQMEKFDQSVDDIIRDAYVRVLYPEQFDATGEYSLGHRKMRASSRTLADRVVTTLENESQLYKVWAPEEIGRLLHTTLRLTWRQDRPMSVKELWDFSCEYIFMPRLRDIDVLTGSLAEFSRTTFAPGEDFALSSGKDPVTGRYLDIRLPNTVSADLRISENTLLVKTDVARAELERARAELDDPAKETQDPGDRRNTESAERPTTSPTNLGGGDTPANEQSQLNVTRYYGVKTLSPAGAGRDFANITNEIINLLVGMGADIEVRLDIQASSLDGFSEADRRVIDENSRTLGFSQHGFER